MRADQSLEIYAEVQRQNSYTRHNGTSISYKPSESQAQIIKKAQLAQFHASGVLRPRP
jgi:hypothetical protein